MASTSNNSSSALNRRDFLTKSAMSAFALSMPGIASSRPKQATSLEALFKETKMGIVVHSYAARWNPKVQSTSYPGFADAMDLIKHCHSIGAGGVQVGVNNWSSDFVSKVRAQKEKLGLYLEGSVGMPYTTSEVDAFDKNIAAAKASGMDVVRTVCTSGRRYEIYHSESDFQTARSKAIAAIKLAEPVLRKHKVKLGVENHKDWRAPELAEILKQISSEWVGATLDFGNSIALMEDPMTVVKTLAPFAVSTHVKDMGLEEYENGVLLSEVPLGTGILDLNEIVSICKKHNPNITFNLEMITRDPLVIPCLTDDYWSTFGSVPGIELARTLRSVREHKSTTPLPRVAQLSNDQRLDVEEQNIIKSLQYSENKLGLK
ncbi:TIM barrel protein [Chryseolinea sp. T2]|uniref:sugar phosphate isomerase/epimerase family protein n=1 Tax=Chryseolinea sp. T2 TaxID=3129255 RepID=UPI003078053D